MSSTIVAVLSAGLTNGALYALATIGLSLVWGSMGMLNMAHGALLAVGGYAAYVAATDFGLPLPVAVVLAVVVGCCIGMLLQITVVSPLLYRGDSHFETSIMIATVGIAIAVQDGLLMNFGGRALKQPLAVDGSLRIGGGAVPYLNIAIGCTALLVMTLLYLFIARTRMGRAIRATAQHRDAAALMGVPVGRVYLQVLGLAGGLAALCGVLLSSLIQLTPTLGADPMLKAFIMCVVAGLGNLPGAVMASFALAVFEAIVQYAAGARWGFPALLIIVIAILIWKPSGLFGRAQIKRM